MKQTLRAFGLLLALKTLLVAGPRSLLLEEPASTAIAMLATVGLVGLVRQRAWGAAALLLALAVRVADTFPHTLNHAWFECLAAVILWRAFASPDVRVIAQAHAVLRFALLSVFFYSGIQKLVHGQFASGEFLMHTVAFEGNHMSDTLRMALRAFADLPRADANELALRPVTLHVSPLLRGVLATLSAGIIAAELVVPLLVVANVRGARWALLATQVGIGLSSGEFDFALTATGIVLLFWAEPPRAAWIGAFVGWAALIAAAVFSA
ncbi:MAG: hypothetical protein ACE37F_00525 [Nannocystaceae bacterium]|nr:hypothetical protein [bacterium]